MDHRMALTLSTLWLLIAAVSLTSSPAQTHSTSAATTAATTTTTTTAATTTPTSSPASSAPALSLLTINWKNDCVGHIQMSFYLPTSSRPSSLPACPSEVKKALADVCDNKKGCKGTPSWQKRSHTQDYSIRGSGSEEASCDNLSVICNVEVIADVQGQLQVYKVVTALLCCVLLGLLMIRFTRPTVKALQKRLSDRRQNRWIGPTQSHSVSYHRGKSAVKNNDPEKRVSYPALERLTITDSREPSSNRNSDYNL